MHEDADAARPPVPAEDRHAHRHGHASRTPRYKVNVNTLEHLAGAAARAQRDRRLQCQPRSPDRLRSLRGQSRDRRLHPDRQAQQRHRRRRPAAVRAAPRRQHPLAGAGREPRTPVRSSRARRPASLWFTGLSGAGKSTIANLVEKRLHALGRHTYLLDGDNVRHGLNKDLGFTDADRVENIRRVAEVSKLMVDAGLIVLVSFISPFRSERRMARELLDAGRVHRDLHRYAAGRGREARSEGPVQEGPRAAN